MNVPNTIVNDLKTFNAKIHVLPIVEYSKETLKLIDRIG